MRMAIYLPTFDLIFISRSDVTAMTRRNWSVFCNTLRLLAGRVANEPELTILLAGGVMRLLNV